MNKVIGIVGSRRRNVETDFQKVNREFFKIYQKGDSICSGGCKTGADNFAEILAEKYDIPIKIYYPDYGRYGRLAPSIRNTDIAKHSDILIACVAKDRKGGTEDTIIKFIDEHSKGKLILC